MAKVIWDMREQLRPQLTDPPTAIARALKEARWPTVLLDSSDNPGGDCPGDSTYLLRAMIEANLTDTCFAAINDREVAAQAHSAGRGSHIRVNLGGKTFPIQGKPIAAEATVLSLSDGKFRRTKPRGCGIIGRPRALRGPQNRRYRSLGYIQTISALRPGSSRASRHRFHEAQNRSFEVNQQMARGLQGGCGEYHRRYARLYE